MGHALCVVCQDAVLDFCEDQSHHLMLLVQRECFNLCYELSARDDSLRWKAPHTWLALRCVGAGASNKLLRVPGGQPCQLLGHVSSLVPVSPSM